MPPSHLTSRGRNAGVRSAMALAGLAIALAAAQPAAAQQWRHDHAWHRGWRGGDFARWRGGYWHHGWHGGRFGWWWVAPGLGWTFYAAPVYPYPEPPPAVPVVAPPPAALPPSAPATWFYCANPPGYYPYVANCLAPWRPVPAH